jgi:glycosyltransferase involved in cell wall biosynthesis
MARDKKINLVIITNQPFPVGMAATNRMLSYSKGLVQLGHSVTVLCLRPGNIIGTKIFNNEVEGYIDGIFFSYSAGTTLWPPSGEKKLEKLKILLTGYFNISKKIIELKKKKKIDFILLVSNEFININYFFLLSKMLRIKYLQEKSEFPFILSPRDFIGKIYAAIYVNYVYKLFDGMIIMTNPLLNYFKKKVNKKSKLLHVPMTVDTGRFEGIKQAINLDGRYLAYVGNMGTEKDGVDILIKSFHKISNRFPDLKLVLIGEASSQVEGNYLKRMVNELSLSKKIIFTGRIITREIPGYLKCATVLCLARPSSLQASGGFPTKLGEYLATGNPVVVTRVGEIPEYLIDNESAFLADADSVASFSSKLDFALANPDVAAKVGEKGREVALINFDYKNQSKRIAEFLINFNGSSI